MSSTPTRTGHPQHPSRQPQQDTDPAEFLGALVDEDCREILRETSGEALSAGEISDVCEIPSSTAYRKVEMLTEAGLLSESVRVCPSGSHTSEYECAVSTVEIEVGDSGIDLSVDSCFGTRHLAAAD